LDRFGLDTSSVLCYNIFMKPFIFSVLVFSATTAFAQGDPGFNLNGISLLKTPGIDLSKSLPRTDLKPPKEKPLMAKDNTNYVPPPKKVPAATGLIGNGEWTRWLEAKDAQGRSVDFGYLPGTQNVDSGSSGFKIFYRCSKFYQRHGGPWQVGMNMEFGNDKGGDIGIVTWTTGPESEDNPIVRFEGTASYSRINKSKDPLPSAFSLTLNALNGIKDFNSLCTHAYKTIAPHRPVIVKYLMKKDIKSMQRLYGATKFIPGVGGLFSEGMEIALSLGTGHYGTAGLETGCAVTGLILEKVTHGVIRSEALKYVIGKSCSGALTGAHALSAGEKSAEYPLYFTGALKADKKSDVLYKKKKWVAFNRSEWVDTVEPMSVHVELGYLEAEKNIKNIFFDKWR